MSTKKEESKSGMTMWDYLHEHPIISFAFVIAIFAIAGSLIYNGYSIKSSALSIEKDKIDTPKQNTQIPNKIAVTPKNSKQYTKVAYTRPIKNYGSDVKKSIPDTIKASIVNVTSNNQQGGITANQVNIGSISRKFDDNWKKSTLSLLPNKNEKIVVGGIGSDQDSMDFASALFEFLVSQGYTNLQGVNTLFGVRSYGEKFERDSEKALFTIGPKHNPIK